MTHPVVAVGVGVPVAGALIIGMIITPTDLTNWLYALTGLVTAIGIIYVNIQTARTAKVTRSIEHATNSAATKAATIIEGQAALLALQKETIAKLEQQAALHAQSAATTTRRRPR